MTVASTPLRKDHTGNGIAPSFIYDWYVANKAHLLVTRVTIATGVQSTLVVDTDYTVTGVGNPAGGTVAISPPLSALYKLVITPNIPQSQEIDFTTEQSVTPERVEEGFDKTIQLIKQIFEVLNRAVVIPVGSTTPATDYISTMQALLASATAAAGTATTQAGIATTGGNTATTQANLAIAAAATATAVAASMSRDVVIVVGPATYNVTQADNGKILACNTAGGAVTVNLASIAALTTPFALGVEKTSADVNTVTINRNGTDTIGGVAGAKTLAQPQATDLVPDVDTSPDNWFVRDYGQVFTAPQTYSLRAGVDFTAGSSTTVTLSPALPSSAGLIQAFNGIIQHPSLGGTPDWTYNPGTGVITYASAIPSDVTDIFVYGFSATTVLVPGAGTVDYAKIASAFLNTSTSLAAASNLTVPTSLAVKSYVDSFKSTLGAPVATTAGTTVNLSTAIPAGVKKFTVNLMGMSTNGGSDILIQLGSGGVFKTAGYTGGHNYTANAQYVADTTGAAVGQTVAATVWQGYMTFILADATNNIWNYGYSIGQTGVGVSVGGGSVALSGVLDRVRFATANGTDTFDAGSGSLLLEVL